MKFLVVFACALAAASAGNLVAPIAGHYPGAQHLPVIGANGVPVDTPAVQQATAEHLAHKVEAHVRNGDYVHHPVVAPVSSAVYPISAGVVSPAGVPLETPEVAAAKINHFAAHAEALARTGYSEGYNFPYSHFYRARRGVVTPVAFNTYAHTPVVAQTYSSFPYAHSSAVFYRKRRQVVAPVAYTGYAHAPVVATSAYTYPYAHNAAVFYRKRRQVVAPVAYTGYAHAPVVATSAYTYPYAHSAAVLYRKRRQVVAPFVASYSHTPVVASSAYTAYPYAHYY